MRVLSLALLGVMFLSACGPTSQNEINVHSETSGIINGSKVKSRSSAMSRAVVGLAIKNQSNQTMAFCTATLIQEDVILTAAHCFDPELVGRGDRFEVYFENDILVQNPKSIKVKAFATHPRYNTLRVRGVEQIDHDIAIALLASPAPEDFEPAYIDDKKNADYGNKIVTVFGYGRAKNYTGRTDEQGWESVGILRQTKLWIDTPYDQLEDRYYVQPSVDNNLICQGDSGGPNFISRMGRPIVIGVNSAVLGTPLANGYSSCSYKAQITKVAPFAGWIFNQIKELRGR